MINGFYKIYVDGELLSTSKNVITTMGKTTIKQFLAGNIPSWSGGIAIGPINSTAVVGDTKLGFEIDRAPTLTKTVDGDGNIVLRAAFPLDLVAVIYEVGVYPFANTTVSGRYQDEVITDFSESSWTGGTIDLDTLSYVGVSNIKLDGASSSATISNLSLDISGYAQTDKFELLVNNLDANEKTLTLAFSDGSTTSTVTLPTIPAVVGAHSVSVGIGQTSVSTITSITITSTGASKDVSLDCLKFLNTDESGYTTHLVSRSVLTTPIVKFAGQDLEVEYYLAGL